MTKRDIREGKVKKGGQNEPPTTPRPDPPVGIDRLSDELADGHEGFAEAVAKELDGIAVGLLGCQPLSMDERLNILTMSFEGEVSVGPGFPNLFARYERTVRALEHEIDGEVVVDRLSGALAEGEAALGKAIARVHDPGDRFSEDTFGADGKAFIAVAMESTTTRVQVLPFSVTVEVESARSKLTLSFEDENAALVWITNLRGMITGSELRRIGDEETQQ